MQLVRCIGVLIYQALDFGLGESEEHALSPDLEQLIDSMTDGLREDDGEQDEGIEDAHSSSSISLEEVMQVKLVDDKI